MSEQIDDIRQSPTLNIEKALSQIKLSAAANFCIDPIDAVIRSEESPEESEQRPYLENVLSAMVNDGEISDRWE